jgi:acetyl esterase/lipase
MSRTHRSAVRTASCCLGIVLALASLQAADAGEPKSAVPAVPAGVRYLPDLTYSAQTGMQVDLAYPRERTGRSPAVLVIHGGFWQEMGGTRKTSLPIVVQLAGRGFVAATVSYRNASDAAFPAQLHDVKCAVRWLRAHAGDYGIDPERIAAVGYSSGGHLAALLGTTADKRALEGDLGCAGQSSRVQAVINCYGPTDLGRLYDYCDNGPCGALQKQVGTSVLRTLLGGTPKSAAASYAQASPLTYVGKGSVPALLIHGTADSQVPFEQSRRFEEALKKAGVSVELLAVEKAGHAFGSGWGGKQGEQADAAVIEFLRGRLQKAVEPQPTARR